MVVVSVGFVIILRYSARTRLALSPLWNAVNSVKQHVVTNRDKTEAALREFGSVFDIVIDAIERLDQRLAQLEQGGDVDVDVDGE